MLLLVALTIGRYLVYLRAPAPYPSPNPPAEAQIAQRLFAADNDERAARGLPAVVWDVALAAQAADWSHDHLPARGEDPPGVQSNVIGRGGCPSTTPSPCYRTAVLPSDGDAHLGWMTSQGHRDNILDPAVTAEGVGAFCGPHGILYATEIFRAAPTSSAQPTTSPSPVARHDRTGMTCSGRTR